MCDKRNISCALITVLMCLLFVETKVYGQDTKNIDIGQFVCDKFTKFGIPNAKVYLMDANHNIIDTTRTREGPKGHNSQIWAFSVPRKPQQYIIRVEHPDYETAEHVLELGKIYRNKDIIFPDLYMKKRFELDEVVVTASKVKIAYKGDTIEVNASAFNIPEGSMLSGLVASVPGCELKNNGDILMNGKKVDYLLLNGKDFFKGNNNIMLDNLPYYVVDKLQFYRKSDGSSLQDMGIKEKDYVMNVKLKRDYQIGYLGNTELAGGTRNRWMARTFNLRFTGNSRISLFSNLNNVNQTNKPSGRGDWRPSQSVGENTTKYVGVDILVDDKDEVYKEHADAMMKWDKNETETRTTSETYLPDNSNYGRQINAGILRNRILTFNNVLEFTKQKIKFQTNFSHDKTKNDFTSHFAQFNSDPSSYGSTKDILDSILQSSSLSGIYDIAVNSNTNEELTNSTSTHIYQNIEVNRKTTWGDYYELKVAGASDRLKRDNSNLYQLDFYQMPSANEDIDQYRWHKERKYDYTAGGCYYFRFLSGLNIGADYYYHQKYNSTVSNLYRLDWLNDNRASLILPSTTDYLQALDASNSYASTNLYRAHEITPGLNYTTRGKNQKYFSINLSAVFVISDEWEHYHRGDLDLSKKINYICVNPNFNIEYDIHSWETIFNYSMDRTTPDIIKTIDYRDTSAPLAIEQGNPELKSSYTHTLDLKTSKYVDGKMVSIKEKVSFLNNMIAQSFSYDSQTGVYTFTPKNVDGNWYSTTEIRGDINLDRNKLFWLSGETHFDFYRNVDHAQVKGSNNSQLSKVNNFVTRQLANLEYQKKDLFIALSGGLMWNKVDRLNDVSYKLNAFNYNYGFSLRYTFPFKIMLSTDMKMYSWRGYNEPSMNTDNLVWNASLSKSFLKGKITAMLEGFDLLHQLSNVSYVVNGQGRTETWQRGLPNYLMLHLSYHFNHNPKKKNGK
jgi:hypothetical protein